MISGLLKFSILKWGDTTDITEEEDYLLTIIRIFESNSRETAEAMKTETID